MDIMQTSPSPAVSVAESRPQFVEADRLDIERIAAMREARMERIAESSEYRDGLERAAYIFAEGVEGGRRGLATFREALSTADFTSYLGDVLDRAMFPRYQEWVAPIQRIVAQGTFSDLTRNKKRYQARGGNQPLGRVGEFGPYPQRGVQMAEYAWKGYKYGADYGISWETWLADDLDGLKDFPGVMASAARVSEMLAITELYVDANGPHASLYSVPNGNLGTAPLSVAALEAAFAAMAAHRDPVTNVPILVRPRYLVVGPENEIEARRIVKSPALTYAGATSGTPFATVNIVSELGLEVIVNPWHAYVGGQNAYGSWYLFADPNSGPFGPGMPAIQFDRMRGLEGPLLLRKRGQFETVGGGADPRGQLSDLDVSQWRIVHPHGGMQLFPEATYASTGAGDPGS